MTRVLVVDPSTTWRSVLISHLASAGFEVVADAATGDEALEQVRTTDADVVVLDLGLEAIQLTHRLIRARPGIGVLVSAQDASATVVMAAMAAGATGYLPKSASKVEFAAAVRLVAAGEPVFPPNLAALVMSEVRPELTEREVDVLGLVALGLSKQSISSRLLISQGIVRAHLRNVLVKLQAHSPAELSSHALHPGAGTAFEPDDGDVHRPIRLYSLRPEPGEQIRHALPIQVYLGDGRDASAVEQALRELLDAAGFEIESSEPPVVGSWFRKLVGHSKDVLTSEEFAETLTLLRRAAELKVLDKPQSDVDSATVDAVAKLVEALSGETNAVIQLGSVFLLKVDGALVVRNLSQHEVAMLRDNNGLFTSPQQLLEALDGDRLCIRPSGGMQSSVKDNEIFARINELVDEEHKLREGLRNGEVSAEDEHERIRELEVTLDRCWDLLRQRRALREYSSDPEQAKTRPATEVEGYQQ